MNYVSFAPIDMYTPSKYIPITGDIIQKGRTRYVLRPGNRITEYHKSIISGKWIMKKIRCFNRGMFALAVNEEGWALIYRSE